MVHDGTMTSTTTAGNKLTVVPSTAASYFYETVPCQAAITNGYDTLQFAVKGAAGGSMAIEIQTSAKCSDTTYTSKFYLVTGITGSTQPITVQLKTAFPGANLDAIKSFVFFQFSNVTTPWEMSQVQFGCGSTGFIGTPVSNAPSQPAPAPANPAGAKPALLGRDISIPSAILAGLTRDSTAPKECPTLLIEDFVSQSRLTFLFYNAMLQPTSDDGTLASVVVSNHRATLSPKGSGYWYSQVGCMNLGNVYGGISLRIKAPAGASFSIELDSAGACGGGSAKNVIRSTQQLGWTFDGTEKLYSIPFSKFAGLDLTKFLTILLSGMNKAITLGPIAFYCGNTVSEFVATTPAVPPGPTNTVAAPPGSAPGLLIDDFANQGANALGLYHGQDDPGMVLTYRSGSVVIQSGDPDFTYTSQLSPTCKDMTSYDGNYLHIAYSGNTAFSVALQQHNSGCNEKIAPFPETWDSLEASRYASATDIYIPMSHFNIVRSRVIGVALKGFWKTDPVTFSKIEIVQSVPPGFKIPPKLPSGNLVFACKRPNSFAFAIDDGDPKFAQQVMKTIRDAGIKVTFFTVGAPLLDPSTNLTNVYRDMAAQGNQIALHSYTHPKMEGLPDYASMDWEYQNDISAVAKQLNDLHTPYFRPPFGTEGARMRQRLAASLGTDNPYIVNWSVDVEDWVWAMSDTPEKQLEAFQRDVNKGGSLVVMHYLYKSTVDYLPRFIEIAKKTGKQLMRVDQCMMDPNAPPL
ncbi:hypothetical protein Vi05172_g2238 [Venturia inaequalis]|nr:hypothetical protein Vi05172_g2238 [Venturia inaequalis]